MFYRSLGKRLAVINQAAHFEPGDRVADVGAGAGWVDAALAITNDSIALYLEDIDSVHLKDDELSQALDAYTKIRGTPLTCTFHQALGTPHETGLPEGAFDKVLLIDTYHHLDFRDDMILDLYRILKENGELVVMEPIARRPGDLYKPCQSIIYSGPFIMSSFERSGFRTVKILRAPRRGRHKVNIFVFNKAP